MKNKKYFVYNHIFPNGKVYIGITSYDKPNGRWRNGEGYKSQYVYKAIKKYGWDNIKHEILFNDLSKEEAEAKEIELIKKYKSNNKAFGYNIENGGHINCVSEETRKKLIGNTNAKGHKIDKEKHKEMILKSQTAEARKKLSKAKSKKIRCVETNVIYINSLEAHQQTGINYANIRSACLGNRKTAGGFHWEEAL